MPELSRQAATEPSGDLAYLAARLLPHVQRGELRRIAANLRRTAAFPATLSAVDAELRRRARIAAERRSRA